MLLFDNTLFFIYLDTVIIQNPFCYNQGDMTIWKVCGTGMAATVLASQAVQYNYSSICISSLHSCPPVYLSIILSPAIRHGLANPTCQCHLTLLFNIFSLVVIHYGDVDAMVIGIIMVWPLKDRFG